MHRTFRILVAGTGLIELAFLVLAVAIPSTFAAENEPISAVYCIAEKVPFFGEILPPVVSIVEEANAKAELDLSPLQLSKMRESDNSFHTGMKSWIASMGEHNDKSKVDEEAKGIGRMVEDARKRTVDVLKPHQMARIKGILFQRFGLLSVPKKDLVQILRLDKAQESVFNETRSGIFRKIDAKANVLASDGNCKFVTAPAKEMGSLLAEGEKVVNRVLTREQLETVRKLKERP